MPTHELWLEVDRDTGFAAYLTPHQQYSGVRLALSCHLHQPVRSIVHRLNCLRLDPLDHGAARMPIRRFYYPQIVPSATVPRCSPCGDCTLALAMNLSI